MINPWLFQQRSRRTAWRVLICSRLTWVIGVAQEVASGKKECRHNADRVFLLTIVCERFCLDIDWKKEGIFFVYNLSATNDVDKRRLFTNKLQAIECHLCNIYPANYIFSFCVGKNQIKVAPNDMANVDQLRTFAKYWPIFIWTIKHIMCVIFINIVVHWLYYLEPPLFDFFLMLVFTTLPNEKNILLKMDKILIISIRIPFISTKTFNRFHQKILVDLIRIFLFVHFQPNIFLNT